MKSSIIERIQEIAARVTEENNLEFVYAKVAGTTNKLVITVFIDKPGGVTHEDCSKVSRNLDTILDAEDFIPSTYLLEVSSPGLERELYSQKDFEKFIGSLAKVKTGIPINGQKNFRGRIDSIEDDEIVFDDKTSGTVRFPYSAVAKANLEIDLDEELKRSEKRKAEREE
jgi:ribosome maturation factor RimP